ncbi:MAG: VWA domain-containing protein [Candidatus Sulfotelmatobacter sp.]
MTVLLLQFCLHPSLAQQTPADTTQVSRSIIANVIDSHGHAVDDLRKENFALFLNGKPAALSSARYNVAPRRIVVLLDVSGSMEGTITNGKWKLAEEAARELLSQREDHAQIAMVTFASEVQKIYDFQQGRTAISKWLVDNADRPANGKRRKTALFDALGWALKLFGAAQQGDAIYAITDGGDNASSLAARQIQKVILQSGVRVFALLFVAPGLSPREEQGENDFAGMIRDSGGQAFIISGRPVHGIWGAQYDYDRLNRENVKTYAANLNTQINGFWILDLTAPISSKTAKVKLLVKGHTGKELTNATLTCPRVLISKD